MCLFRKRWSVSFYKEGDEWYADMPNRTKEENIMIDGSDKLLDLLYSKYGSRKNRITVIVQKKPYPAQLILYLLSRDQEGAIYRIDGPFARENRILGQEAYLCDVALDIFRTFPTKIYIVKFF